MLVDPQAAEKLVEASGLVDVVIQLEGADQGGLAKPPRAQKDDVLLACRFDVRQKGRLVDVEIILRTDRGKIAGGVGNLHGVVRRAATVA